MAIQMTRAEYEAKYGAPPAVPPKPPTLAQLPAETIVKRKQDAYAVPAGSLNTNLRNEKLQKLQNEQAEAKAEAKKANSFGGFMGNFGDELAKNLTIGTRNLGQTIGQSFAAPKVTEQIAQDRNLQSDVLVNLSKRIRANEAAGKDTTKLKLAYNNLADDYDPEEMKRILPVLDKTNAQVGGELAGTALDLVGGATLAKAGGAVVSTIAKPTLSKATLGRIAGPTALGYATDVASGLQGSRGEDRDGAAALIPGMGTTIGLAAPVLGTLTRGAGKGANNLRPEVRAASATESARKFISDLVTPTQTKSKTGTLTKNILAGRVQEGGVFAGRSVVPDARQINMENAVSSVPGVSKKNTLLQNNNAIHDEIGVAARDLRTQLQNSNPDVPKARVDEYMKAAIDEIEENPVLVGDAGTTAVRILNKFKSFLPEGGSVKGTDLLDARQRLDKWLQTIKGSKVFDPQTDTAVTIALRSIRQGANGLLADVATDVPVKELLKRQALLYDAIENIAPKAAKEGGSVISRLASNNPLKARSLGYIASGILGAGAVNLGAGMLTGD